MQRLEVSRAVRLIYKSLGVKGLSTAIELLSKSKPDINMKRRLKVHPVFTRLIGEGGGGDRQEA